MSTTTLTGFLGTTGLTDVGYRFIDADGVFTGTRQTASVYELAGARGIYGIKNPSIPSDATKVYWDSTGTALAYAYEQLDYCMTRLLVDRTSDFTGAVAMGAVGINTLTVGTGVITLTQLALINPGGDSPLVIESSDANPVILLTGTNGINVAGTTVLTGNISAPGVITAANASNNLVGFSVSVASLTAIATAVWNRLTSALTVVGSIGKALVDTITGTGGVSNFTITVTDGTNPLQAARFNLFNGAQLIASGFTDVNGNFSASAPNGTFEVALYLANFTFGTVSRTVTGNHTGTLESQDLVMTALTPPIPPVGPEVCTLFGFIVDGSGNPLAGATVTAQIVPQNGVQGPLVTTAGSVVTMNPVTGTSDVNGLVTLDVVQSDVISPEVSYTITSSNGQINRSNVQLSTPTQNLNAL